MSSISSRYFMPFKTGSAGEMVRGFPLANAQTIYAGDPVYLNTGLVTLAADNTDAVLTGIASTNSIGIAMANSVDENGTSYATGTQFPVAMWSAPNVTWIANRGSYSTAGGGAEASVAPVIGSVGLTGALLVNAGVWFLDTAAGSADAFRVIDVLDAFKVPIGTSGGTGVYAVFKPLSPSVGF